jgi:hypothetical protein
LHVSYLILDTLEDGGEDVKEIIEQLLACEVYCNAGGDRFNAGFFHTLIELLSVRFNIALLDGEMIDRGIFEEDWQEYAKSWGYRKNCNTARAVTKQRLYDLERVLAVPKGNNWLSMAKDPRHLSPNLITTRFSISFGISELERGKIWSGQDRNVVDGDTIDVAFGTIGIQRIRLAGINTPEIGEDVLKLSEIMLRLLTARRNWLP